MVKEQLFGTDVGGSGRGLNENGIPEFSCRYSGKRRKPQTLISGLQAEISGRHGRMIHVSPTARE